MAIGTVTKYDQFESIMAGEAGRQWDVATAGSCMFYLADASYTPATTHTTVANIGVADTDYIDTGDGAPIDVDTPTLDAATTAGTTYWDSLVADFGASVTITAKYLVCVQPVVAATKASTAKLLWYVDLDTTTTSTDVSSTASAFKINPSANGWISSI